LDVALTEKTKKALSLAEEKSKLSNEVEDLKKEVTAKGKILSLATSQCLRVHHPSEDH